MHEWALAEAVLSAASSAADEQGLSEVTEVRVKVGELQQIDPEILQFAFSQIRTGKFKNARLTIRKTKTSLNCRVCGHKWIIKVRELEETSSEDIHFVPEVVHAFVKCPKCGSPDFEIVEGRGIWLETVKGVKMA